MRLDASPIWHLEVSGIPTVNQAAGGRREWRPWPGEVVGIAATRPAGVVPPPDPGPTPEPVPSPLPVPRPVPAPPPVPGPPEVDGADNVRLP